MLLWGVGVGVGVVVESCGFTVRLKYNKVLIESLVQCG
jgi:hypothetical protein